MEQTHVRERLVGYRNGVRVELAEWGDGRPDDTGEIDRCIAATRPSSQMTVWHTCPKCHFPFPETQMAQVGGRWYSIKYGCARDAQMEASR